MFIKFIEFIKHFLVEIKRAYTAKNLLKWIFIILLIPTISFFPLMNGYRFYEPVELFQSMTAAIIPLLFPVLSIIIYLPSFLQEKKNNFIFYTQPRIPLQTYILSKGLVNVFLTGFIIFLLIFLSFVFAIIEPNLGIIEYDIPHSVYGGMSEVTFSQLLVYGDFMYGLIYSLWVSINAIIYSSISFMLMLLIRSQFVALSVPFLFYHIFNFITGVLGEAKFSPISTIFPFNIVQQPLWTVLVPFSFLLISLIVLIVVGVRKQEDWVI